MSRRRRFPLALLIALLLAVSAPIAPGGARKVAAAPPGAPEAAPNQLLVGFKSDTDDSARAAAVSRRGGRILKRFAGINANLIELPAGRALPAEIAILLAERGVRYVEPNYIARPIAAPNDAGFGNLWGLFNSGQFISQYGTAGADIGATTAWETTTGSRNVVVGVVDTGVDYTHPDLAANIWSAPPGWNLKGCGPGTHGFRSVLGATSCDPVDSPQQGHGTHVAGTIGATGDNGTGVVGVNWQVSLMPLRFFPDGGGGYVSDAIEVIDYAIEAKQAGVNLRVLSNSWGGGGYSQALLDKVNEANANGILFVAAAGNGGADNIGDNNDAAPFYPASYNAPNVIAVAATDNQDHLAGFSNYGATSVHLGAPGVNTYSTYLNAGYAWMNGTSMATPHVSGAAALLLAVPGFENLTVAQVRARLLNCGDAIPALSGKTTTGRRLNVARAISGAGGCAAAPAFALTLPPATGGSVSASPAPGPYAINTAVTLTPAASAGYTFAGWTLDGAPAGSAAPLGVTMTRPHTVAASFAATNPVPAIGSLSPPSATAGGGQFALVVNGANFAPGAVVRWNGADLATTYDAATQLTAAVPAALIATARTASVAVANPAPGGTSASADFAISAASQTITFPQPADHTYGDPPFAVSATASSGLPVSFSAAGACTVAGDTVTLTGASACTITAEQGGNGTYAAAPTVARTFNSGRVNPVITWAQPSAIAYGTALGGAQLHATADVPGSFVYTPPAGTILGAGANQPLNVTFTPDDTANYNVATANNQITVDKANPAISWPPPAPITYGTALGAAQLNASADQPGTFAYSDAAGAVPGAGVRTLAATFTPADMANYNAVPASVSLTVQPAPLTVTIEGATKVYGAALPAFVISAGGFVNGDTEGVLTGAATYATSATSASPVGSYAVTPGGLTAANYTIAYAAGTLAIAPAPLTISASSQSRAYGLLNPALDATYDGLVLGQGPVALAGTLACATTAKSDSAPGTYPISCGGQSSANYAISYVAGTLTVLKAEQVITFGPLADRALTSPPFDLSASASSGLPVAFAVAAGGTCALAGATLTLVSTGTCTVTASQPGDGNYNAAPGVARSFQITAVVPPPEPTTTPASSPSPSPSPTPSPSAGPGPSPSPTPSPAPSPGSSYLLTILPASGGTVASSHAPGALAAGTAVMLTATPAPGQVFLGWTVNGTLRSYANPVQLVLSGDRTVAATFTAHPLFQDVSPSSPAAEAIAQLAARGVINGCDATAVPPFFCPDAPTLRHQMAALIVRAMPGWADEAGLPTFTDNTADTELMTRVATVQRHGVAQGYQAEVCAAQGKAAPCYGPLDTVKYGQVMLFIARAMVAHGYWALQPDDRGIFPDQNGAAGANPDTDRQTLDHRMVVTYVKYAGAPPDVASVTAPFAVALTGGGVAGWGDAAPRAWFARALWLTLASQYNHGIIP